MGTIRAFILITCVAPLWADKNPFAQQKALSYYDKIISYTPFLRRSSQPKAVVPQSQSLTSLSNEKNFTLYLESMTASRPRLARAPFKKEDIVAQLKNKLTSKKAIPSFESSSQFIYNENVKNNLILTLKNSSDLHQFADKASHVKTFLAASKKLLNYYSDTQHPELDQLTTTLNTFIVKKLQEITQANGVLDTLTQELTYSFLETFKIDSIRKNIGLCENFVKTVQSLLRIIEEKNGTIEAKNITLQAVNDAFLTIFNNAKITAPKDINELCFVRIKGSLYQYILQSIDTIKSGQVDSSILDTKKLKSLANNIKNSINTASKEYELASNNTHLSKNFDASVLDVWKKVFSTFDTRYEAINFFIANKTLPFLLRNKSTIDASLTTNYNKSLLITLKNQKLELTEKAHIFLSFENKELSYAFIDDYLSILDNFRYTANAYIRSIKQIQSPESLLSDIQWLTQFFLDQQAAIKIKISMLKTITSQILYNYVAIQEIALYATNTLQDIITLYQHDFGDHANITIIQNYLMKLGQYMRNKINFETR